MIQPYNVACIQTTIRQVRDPATRDEAIRENLYRGISLMEYASIRFGQPKLVVLPEFYLTGADHLNRTIEQWTKVGFAFPVPRPTRWAKRRSNLKCTSPAAPWNTIQNGRIAGSTAPLSSDPTGTWSCATASTTAPTSKAIRRTRRRPAATPTM